MKEFDLSVSYFKEGKFELALEKIESCIKADAANLEYVFFRARVNSRLGSFEKALEDFDRLIGFEPFNPTYITDRAVVLHLLKRNQEAMEEFDRALNLDPSNPYRYSSRAYFKDRIGDFKGAIEDYNKAIDLDPEDAVAHNNRGLIEEKLGYIEKSKKSFNKADELVGYNPSKTNADEIEQGSKNSLPPIGSISKQNENANIGENQLSFSKYLGTLKNVFTDRETQKEFLQFIKSGFKRSAD
ncbi:tetratricopeptide repeat protein [Cecembia sp.]|uniref:tetratricopeptide repeat protein n=1 Tax=Cecembia sp. TaxID=1898110 RepID=UPI0025C6FC69|nr:tetratricopeptide repeat protein [Cecembia sp.]